MLGGLTVGFATLLPDVVGTKSNGFMGKLWRGGAHAPNRRLFTQPVPIWMKLVRLLSALERRAIVV